MGEALAAERQIGEMDERVETQERRAGERRHPCPRIDRAADEGATADQIGGADVTDEMRIERTRIGDAGSWALRSPDVLRLLCYGPHHIHPEYAGMQANLTGRPLGSRGADS